MHLGTVIVTGASSGFGLAIAQAFLGAGDRVVACARRLAPLQDLERSHPGRVLPLALDMRDRAAVAAAFSGLPPDWSAVDVLVNNAGLAAGLEPAQRSELDDWDRMIETNCTGLVHATRALLPAMVSAGRGTVINIGSVAGEFPYPGGNVYGATKAFVHQFTQNLNADLVGTGVRATCIEPGLCGGTEFSQVRFHGDAARAQAVYAGTEPLSAGDVAEAVLWVARLPARVTINVLQMMPNCQSFGGMRIERRLPPQA
jgi:NADP-dependent 3-hydroxy acid dehydrogenase YdfG